MRVDSNTKGHIQWFNFKVKNMKKGIKYTFHICNFQKQNSLYCRGGKPYIFSEMKNEIEKVGWEQGCSSIKYERKVPKTATLINFE